MIYLNNYLIFENVQQFEKILASYMKDNPDYDNYGLYKLKDKAKVELSFSKKQTIKLSIMRTTTRYFFLKINTFI